MKEFSQSKWLWVNQRANGHAHVDETYDRFQTLRINSQIHATKSNRVWKRMQHITFNNIEPKMFRPFAQGLISCKFFLLYRYWWNTRIFRFTKTSYLHRAQWRYYFLSREIGVVMVTNISSHLHESFPFLIEFSKFSRQTDLLRTLWNRLNIFIFSLVYWLRLSSHTG